jgi:hypothetical protein
MDNNGYERLLELKEKIENSQANESETSEYMELMYKNGHITKSQYESFKSSKNSDAIIKGALTIGGIIIAGWLISKLID